MKKILISACLAGRRVRYDGSSINFSHPALALWRAQGRLVPFCPEVEGGLGIPRPPAEIIGGTGMDVLDNRAGVVTKDYDVTRAFLSGAKKAFDLCRQRDISLALLKDKSPSCGVCHIYSGSFNGRLVPGQGVTAALLESHGVLVFCENQIHDLESLLG